MTPAATFTGKTMRILIVDDHPTVCEGLGHRINSQADMSVCGQAPDVGEALKKITELHPDVVIVDIALKSSDGLELIKAIKARFKCIRPLVHSMYEETVYADRCLHAGAMGYVNKESDPNDVIEAIRTVYSGRVYLSPAMSSLVLGRTVHGQSAESNPVDSLTDRQLEVFRLIGAGRSANQIANQLHISVHTVETHRDNIKRKLGAATVNELARLAVLWVDSNR